MIDLSRSHVLLSDLKQSISQDRYSEDLPYFIRSAWNLVEPSTPLSWNWHLDELCLALSEVSKGNIKRLIINIPPGLMKSLSLVMWNAWEWIKEPSRRYLTFSYTDDNTIRDNRRIRSIVTSEWYQNNFWRSKSVSLSSDQSAKIRFDNTAKGWRVASSVGGVGTGEHPDRIIIDDPLKAADARSITAMKNCQEWMDRTISTRIANDPAIIIVMQRLHLEDLSGYLLSKGDWEHILFPMRYRAKGKQAYKCSCHSYKVKEVNESGSITEKSYSLPDKRDHRRIEGDLIWSEKWPEEKVKQEELDLGPFGTAGQLDQDPVPEGGGLFKREWFTYVDAAPVIAKRCRGWDIAETDGGGDWTAGVKLAREDNGIIYVEDVVSAQLTLVDSLIKQTAISDSKQCKIREGSGSGKATIKTRSIMLAGWDYAASPETDDKVSRANPFRAQCEAGNVRLVRGNWNEDYLSELCSFPVGKFDDKVDASSNAANELMGNIEEEIELKIVY
jgi:predicted phage terminase large subunit-like protein